MSYHVVDDRGATLGFSLKPPKWLRKMQPGKFLLPAAAVVGTLLIPGVGGAVAGAAGAAAKGIASASSGFARVITGAIKSAPGAIQTLSTAAGTMSPAGPMTTLPSIATNLTATTSPMTPAPSVPPAAGGSAQQPAGPTMAMMPLLVGAAALMIVMSSRPRGR